MGSLVCALASYLDVKAANGHWLIRIEDVDTVRTTPGTSEHILKTLGAHGFFSDSDVVIQSERSSAYSQALETLQTLDICYSCSCSRKKLQGYKYYPGFCRENPATNDTTAIRLKTNATQIRFKDEIQGYIEQNLATEPGDFILKRKDGLFAYHLAVVVDDAAQGVNRILRGIDLLDCSPAQIYLQQLLGLESPSYAHIPVIVNQQHQKLSKQTYAQEIDTNTPCANLLSALTLLGQKNIPSASRHSVFDILDTACMQWDLNPLIGHKAVTLS